MPALMIYSPATPTTILHRQNQAIGAALESRGLTNTVEALALPQSVNLLAEKSPSEKSLHLPILTTVDVLPAILGVGPKAHTYVRANHDLKFITSLYDVGFGVLAFDNTIKTPADLRGKRIAAFAPSSSVRVFTEALLQAWQIREDVEILEIPPSELEDAILSQRVDATTQLTLCKTSQGFLPTLPSLLQIAGARWIDVDETTVAAINTSQTFKTQRLSIEVDDISCSNVLPDKPASLLSFRQALMGWDSTPASIVRAILSCLESDWFQSRDLRNRASEMASWPALTSGQIHEAALAFYRENGLEP
ncbi:MAG: ABC transporter substrate-binding protein [Pigmentiphaga sp.]